MLSLSSEQFRKALVYLSLLHILIIAASNYLVQFPFEIFGLHNTWGAVTFPFIFLATDLTVRVFGKELARRIIFAVMFPALLLSYVISVIFAQGAFTGFSGLDEFNLFVARIALASFMAYLLGQLLDIKVFDRLRRHSLWWVAPAASTLVGNALDTLIFFSVAFYASPDAFMAAHWPEIALVDYGFKLTLSLVIFLPAYGLFLAWLQQHLLRVAPSRSLGL
ncbi:7-cyano-7-deazaguanine/7-aminomethyl-7-deazaguanine transporter [Marinospirillum perlucidum]|uniref:7-cyano-7-deazaguanine/7-aminomethyl-7- deazaguanine transporter n=1 Tax=Marinospirillum perlucidum TaxID=1982602 RepID=UPI000DF2A121|nr:7-cyano-7-deazaguanine/7-aminomethyl-7-deazaguanine transporter [Marinospirillum perlucidum]